MARQPPACSGSTPPCRATGARERWSIEYDVHSIICCDGVDADSIRRLISAGGDAALVDVRHYPTGTIGVGVRIRAPDPQHAVTRNDELLQPLLAGLLQPGRILMQTVSETGQN